MDHLATTPMFICSIPPSASGLGQRFGFKVWGREGGEEGGGSGGRAGRGGKGEGGERRGKRGRGRGGGEGVRYYFVRSFYICTHKHISVYT